MVSLILQRVDFEQNIILNRYSLDGRITIRIVHCNSLHPEVGEGVAQRVYPYKLCIMIEVLVEVDHEAAIRESCRASDEFDGVILNHLNISYLLGLILVAARGSDQKGETQER